MILNEVKRTQLLSQGKQGEKEKDGKSRYQKRVKSHLRSNISQLNKLDFNKLFKDNTLIISLDVDGETNSYLVTISFKGFLDYLHKELARVDDKLSLRVVIRALLDGINSDDVYMRCSCEDYQFRMAYWASRNNTIVGDKETRPSNITNPNNRLGSGCKHIMLVLANTSWMIKLGSVIFNYINYMERNYKKLYSDVIYPAIYNKKYEEPVQLDIDSLDNDELDTTSSMIDKSNKYARDKNKFQTGNKWRFPPKQNKNQLNISIFDDENKDEE